MMMEVFENVLYGFQVALTPENLLFCFIGVLVGTLVGVLPGIGPTGTIALLLPVTFHVSPTSSLILLTGVLYGAMYGGSTTSILVNIPGEASSVVTTFDGYQMARQGRAGPALGIAAWGSFIAGTLSVVALAFVAVPLARAALRFGPPEYFALMCMGLVILTYLSRGSTLKALMMAVVGLIVGCIGLDMVTGLPRYTLGIEQLIDGVGIVPISMGLFGMAEVFENVEKVEVRDIYAARIKNLWPSLADWSASKFAIIRGTIIGFLCGLIPGGGGTLASFVSYGIEKRVSKHPEKFGTGVIEGVAAPEAANNSTVGGGLIPLVSLGIPPNATLALLYAALVIHGVQPGPFFIKESPDVFWGFVASMYVGNVFLIILNLPLIGIWIQVLKVPYRILMPLITLFCIIGAYGVNSSAFDIFVMIFFGALGYLMRKFGYEAAPLILAVVLGPMLEQALRQSLMISRGSFLIFVNRPISAVALSIAVLLLLTNLIPFIRKRGQELKESAGE